MSTLYGRAPKDTYQEMLTIDNDGVGLDTTLRFVMDGVGQNSPLKLSLSTISILGAAWPTTGAATGKVLSYGSDGNLAWITPASGGSFSGSYTDLTNIPTFATVATTGSYNDLTNKPSFNPLPSQTNNSGKYLFTDGSTASWASAPSITAGNLTGATLASNVLNSSLTSLGTVASLSAGSISMTGTLTIDGDAGTSGYILASGGSSVSPTWIPNTGATSLAATGTFPSTNSTAGVYAGVTGDGPTLALYNFAAAPGNRYTYITQRNDGTNLNTTGFGFNDSTGVAQDWLTINRTQNTASLLAFQGSAFTFSGPVTVTGLMKATTVQGSFSGSGASLTNLNASNIASGTVGTAFLGSGTPTSTTYLSGSGAWTNPFGGSAGSSGQVLTSNGGGAPGWQDKVYEIALSISGVLTNSAVVLSFVPTVTVTLPASLTGSFAKVGTTGGATSFTMKKNGTTVGTINYASSASSGTFSFSSAVTLSPGDLFTITAPASADPNFANAAITLKGTYV